MNTEIELINAVLDYNSFNEAVQRGADECFQDHKEIWHFVRDFHSKYNGSLPQKKILMEKFPNEFQALVSSYPFQYYIDEAKAASLSKNIRSDLQKTITILRESGPEAALNHMMNSSHRMMKNQGMLADTDLVGDFEDRVENFAQRYGSDKHILGIPTMIEPIDEIFGGLQPGDVVTIIGWTASRKSWLAILFALNAWHEGYSPMLLSLELNKYQVGYRFDTFVNGGQGITNSDLMNARGLSPEEYAKWANDTFAGKQPFHLITSEGLETASQNVLDAKIRQYRPDLVIVDYLNLLDDAKGGGTETDRIRNISKDLKRIAVKNQVPIVVLSAVTMSDGHDDRPPLLSEVAWSKQISYDADLVLGVHTRQGSNITQVVTRKTRRCPDFAFFLNWDVNNGTWEVGYGDEYEFSN